MFISLKRLWHLSYMWEEIREVSKGMKNDLRATTKDLGDVRTSKAKWCV